MVLCSAFGCKSRSERKDPGITFHRNDLRQRRSHIFKSPEPSAVDLNIEDNNNEGLPSAVWHKISEKNRTCLLCGRLQAGKGLSFFKFPLTSPDKFDKWVKNMQRTADWIPNKNDRLCSKHFESHWFCKGGTKTNLLHGAVPTLFLELPEYLLTTQDVEKTTKRPLPDSPVASTLSTSQEDEETPRKKQAIIRLLPDIPVASTSEEGEETLRKKQATIRPLPDSPFASTSQESEETPRNENFRRLQRKLYNEVEKNKEKSRKIRVLGQKLKRYEKRFAVMKQIIKDLKRSSLLSDD